MTALSEAERAILRELLGGIPEGARPYAVVASRVGLAEDDVLATIRRLVDRGIVRRVAGVAEDGKLGYGGNAMVVWRIPCDDPSRDPNDALRGAVDGESDDALDRAGLAAAARAETSHVYARRATPEWPYNLYTMVHARSRDEVETLVNELRPLLGATDHRVLFTLREFTKRPPCYPLLTGCAPTMAHEGREVPTAGRQVE